MTEEESDTELRTRVRKWFTDNSVGYLSHLYYWIDHSGYRVRQRGEYSNLCKLCFLIEPCTGNYTISLDDARTLINEQRPVGVVVTLDLWGLNS